MALPLDILACPGRDCDKDGFDEEEGHDDEGKNPLQGNDLAEELSDANGGGKDAEGEAHGIVLSMR